MITNINSKKVGLFLLFAFLFSWASYLLLKLIGVSYGSTIYMVILAIGYMPGPAIAAYLVQKVIYKESLSEIGWKLDLKNKKWILQTILVYFSLMLLTLLVIFILGNILQTENYGMLDFSPEGLQDRLGNLMKKMLKTEIPELPDFPPFILLIILLFQGVIAGFTINLPFMFGEEFGWRGLFLKEVKSMGFIKSSLLIGIVWGIWHLPIILDGHNYPSNPKMGALMMCLFTTGISPLFTYIRIKSNSIIGPCALHGMINATGAIFLLYVANGNEFYASVAGWAGFIAAVFTIGGIYIFDKKFLQEFHEI